jgi:hypothetical protein
MHVIQVKKNTLILLLMRTKMDASDQLWAVWAYPSAAVHGEIVQKSVYMSTVVVILVHKLTSDWQVSSYNSLMTTNSSVQNYVPLQGTWGSNLGSKNELLTHLSPTRASWLHNAVYRSKFLY